MALLLRLKRTLVHPAVVLVLLGLLAAVFAVGVYLPERPFATAPAGAGPFLGPAGLKRLLATQAPAALVVVTLLSLALATWDIGRTAWSRTTRRSSTAWRSLPPGAAEAVERAARRRGFIPLPSASGRRLVRHPWSLWANFLLHAGMLVAAAAFQLYAATERQGSATLVEGQALARGTDLEGDYFGPLASELHAPVGVRLDRVDWEASAGGALHDVDSTLALELPGGTEEHELSPNDSHYHWGYRLYHGPSGHAFLLEVVPPDAPAERHALLLPLPQGPGAHSYGDLDAPLLGGRLRAKYRIAARAFPGGTPELTLRLVRGPGVAGQVELAPGAAASLGGGSVSLVEVRRWSSVRFDAGRGMTVVLAAFALMTAGALLLYLAPARELVLEPGPDGALRAGWTAYRDRADDELAALLGPPPGAGGAE